MLKTCTLATLEVSFRACVCSKQLLCLIIFIDSRLVSFHCKHIYIFILFLTEGVAAAPNGSGVAPSITSGMNVGAGGSQKHRGAVSASNPNTTHHHPAHAAHTTSSSSSATAMKGPLSLNGTGAANPNGDHSQEELLRQLFPSWF